MHLASILTLNSKNFSSFYYPRLLFRYPLSLPVSPVHLTILIIPDYQVSPFTHVPYLHVYVCLFICFMLVLASLVLGFAMLNALNGHVVVWLHLTLIRPCLDTIT